MRLVLAAAKSTHKAIKSSACYLGISTESVSEKNAQATIWAYSMFRLIN